MCRSAEKLSGMLKIPVRTHLIPAKWLESRKGGGSVAWWGKGAKERNYLVPLRQRKVCMVKAKLPKPQLSRF